MTHSLNLSSISRVRALAGGMEWGGEQALLSAGIQIANFSDFNGSGHLAVAGDPTTVARDDEAKQRLREGLTAGASGGSVRWITTETVDLEHDGWRISLVAVPQSGDRYKQLKATGGYAFTHVGQLTRIDASAFCVQQAKEILESLRVFLSFARGAACGLPIQWGRGIDGEIVWRRFVSPIVDRWQGGYRSWFDEHHGETLTDLFASFCHSHRDPKLRESLGLALHWYRHCNTNSSGLEGSLVLGMAALDLLGALLVVERCGSLSANKYDRSGAARKLEALLRALKIQTNIPQKYEKLTAFAKRHGLPDACSTLVRLRNGYVHAKEQRRRVVFGSHGKAAAFNASQLSLWYQELALLRVLDYRGSYRNRTTATHVGQVEPVPWSRL